MKTDKSKILHSAVIGPLVAFLIIFIIAALITPRFLLPDNLANQMLQVSVVSIIAIGSTMVIITGGIDISSGSAVAFLTMVMAELIKFEGFSLETAIIVVLALGTILGLYNGILIAYLRIPAFIATLASQGIFRGFSFMLNNGAPLQKMSESSNFIFYSTIFGIPIVVYYIIFFYGLAYIFMKYTRTGRKIYAIGGNASAARLSGINVKKTNVITYTLAGFLTACAAVLMACRLNSGSQNYGIGMEMSAIAASVIGGASLAGGKGNMICTFIGAMTIVIVQNALNLHAVPTAVQQIAIGLIIMLAVILDMWRTELGNVISKLFRKKEA